MGSLCATSPETHRSLALLLGSASRPSAPAWPGIRESAPLFGVADAHSFLSCPPCPVTHPSAESSESTDEIPIKQQTTVPRTNGDGIIRKRWRPSPSRLQATIFPMLFSTLSCFGWTFPGLERSARPPGPHRFVHSVAAALLVFASRGGGPAPLATTLLTASSTQRWAQRSVAWGGGLGFPTNFGDSLIPSMRYIQRI